MNERDIDISVKSLPGPLNFESLFSRFCVRWLEQRFDDFMTDVVPKLLDDNKEWAPVGTDADSKWSLAAKDLRFFITTSLFYFFSYFIITRITVSCLVNT